MAWHDTWSRMKRKPHVLIVTKQAIGPSWCSAIEMSCRKEQEPWDHQLAAAEWLENRKHGLLSMDMGTGKTLVALLASKLFGQSCRVVDLTQGTSVARHRRLKEANSSGQRLAVVVNYESVYRGDLGKLIDSILWEYIVLDESHCIKAPGGKSSRWLARFASHHPEAKRFCLTGTPMPHSKLDVYGQFRFLDPTIFGTSFVRFRHKYADLDPRFPSKVIRWKNDKDFTDVLDEHTWRVTSDEVLDLPTCLHQTLAVELDPKSRKFYNQIRDEAVADIASGKIVVSNALTKLLRLQQATSGYVNDEDNIRPLFGKPAKRLMLQTTLEDLPVEEPVVVMCRFRHDLNEVAAVAKDLGRPYAEVSGTKKQLERWTEGDATILGCQIQSGGVGINLTRAAYCFYYSLGFSLGDYEQSLARLHRPGQTRCVRYYHLVAKNTVDEQVYGALRERRSVIDAVLDELTPRTENAANE